jgi:uncharacterized membrane protein
MNRVQLKNNAKYILKKHYLVLLIVSFIVAIVGGGTSGNFGMPTHADSSQSERLDHEFARLKDYVKDNDMLEYGADVVTRGVNGLPLGKIINWFIGFAFSFLAILISAVTIFFVIFITFPVKVGGSRVYIDSADGVHEPLLSRLAFAFRSGHYMNIVKAGFLRSLYLFLWSLLFVIPGIIKGYAYSMTPYILADSPDMSASEALRLSEQMMRGHKMELFIQELSFIGWYILGMLAFGIGVYLVHPYKDATEAQFYMALRSAYIAPTPVTGTSDGYSAQ